MNLKDKYVLVVGCGISGIGAAKLLSEAGAYPVLFDGNDLLDQNEIEEKLPVNSNIIVRLGQLETALEEKISLLVLSPGVPIDSKLVLEYRKKNLPIWGEVELAYAFEKGSVLAITGTNGKTTTTALTGQIMQEAGKETYVVGNIGNAYTKEVNKTNEHSVTVAEISSFQLETIESFRPHISAVLNITPDHLNRHHTMENYVAIKESISKNQDQNDYLVLNYEDQYTKAIGERSKTNIIWFSSKRELTEGYYLKDDVICYAKNGRADKLLNIHEMKLLGVHNVENVMAAIAITAAFGVPMKSILQTVKNFKAVEHRIEYVATKRGVDYYNDSKGTNPDAAIQGIRAMNKKTVLIGGGYDKQNTYDEWIESFDGKVKLLVLIGQTKEKIRECALQHDFHNIVLAESFEEAMQICVENAKPGEAVLLSPACASWGMFSNYEVRGKIFKELVMQIV